MIDFVCSTCKLPMGRSALQRGPGKSCKFTFLVCPTVDCAGFGRTLRMADAVRATYGFIKPWEDATLEVGRRGNVYELRPIAFRLHILFEVTEHLEDALDLVASRVQRWQRGEA